MVVIKYQPIYGRKKETQVHVIRKLGQTVPLVGDIKSDDNNKRSNTAKDDDSSSVQQGNSDVPVHTDAHYKSPKKMDPVSAAKRDILDPKLPRFGPAYGKDDPFIESAKKEAWNHALESSRGLLEDNNIDPESTYINAIKNVEKEAKAAYDPDTVGRIKSSEFQKMMAVDGCFFLNLALYILGGSEVLGYSEKHVYFSKTVRKDEKTVIGQWIKSMFFVGNQIPCAVIRELMKQSFFQKVIRDGKGKWLPPFHHLPSMALYLIVVSPELEDEGSTWWPFSKQKKQPSFRETPSNLLHGFHSLVLGTGNDPDDDDGIESNAIDLESGPDDFDDKNNFPSASELEASGIKLRRVENGTREISFRNHLFLFARLYVPPFTYDDDTESVLRFLKSYEIEQGFGTSKREVNAYLRFMKDLVQTQKDVSILQSRGIFQVNNKYDRDKLPGLLHRLGSSQGISLTPNLSLVRFQITDYRSPPWHLISLAFIFTLVQTVFTVLGYFVPFKN